MILAVRTLIGRAASEPAARSRTLGWEPDLPIELTDRRWGHAAIADNKGRGTRRQAFEPADLRW
jgi:hypothetical protein